MKAPSGASRKGRRESRKQMFPKLARSTLKHLYQFCHISPLEFRGFKMAEYGGLEGKCSQNWKNDLRWQKLRKLSKKIDISDFLF